MEEYLGRLKPKNCIYTLSVCQLCTFVNSQRKYFVQVCCHLAKLHTETNFKFSAATKSENKARYMSSVAQRGGGTLIISYIHRLGSFLGVQIFEFQYFWGFSEKLLFFWV